MELAKCHGVKYVRVWIDRLISMGLSRKERKEKNNIDWTDYGLFAYTVCPVIRLYEEREAEYGTNFWRKLETVMGIAGRGLVADDYMLSSHDYDILWTRALS